MSDAAAPWDPILYERYKQYRDRPALDLLLQTPSEARWRQVWDLGCGTGEIAAVLAARYPEARVHGLDSSREMLDQARNRSAKVDWILGDIAQFKPDLAPDLIFSNAALYWLADHHTLFPRLVGLLAPGGVFACQMPDGRGANHRRIVEELARSPPWRDRFETANFSDPVAAPEQYHQWLTPLCASVDIWRTSYLHELAGDDPVIDWLRATFLRPYLNLLAEEERVDFLAELRRKLGEAFPRQKDGGVLFPFPRLFIVARRSEDPLHD